MELGALLLSLLEWWCLGKTSFFHPGDPWLAAVARAALWALTHPEVTLASEYAAVVGSQPGVTAEPRPE